MNVGEYARKQAEAALAKHGPPPDHIAEQVAKALHASTHAERAALTQTAG